MDDPRRRGDQIREMKLGLHPGMKESLATLCADPNTIIVVLSGSERGVLDEVVPLIFEIATITQITHNVRSGRNSTLKEFCVGVYWCPGV